MVVQCNKQQNHSEYKADSTMSKTYSGEFNSRIAFPLGGIGAGMFSLEGRGALSQFSIRNQPNVFWEPCVFSALCVKGAKNVARILEGPVPRWKGFGLPGSGNGLGDKAYGLPRLASASFSSAFPFGTIEFEDKAFPVQVKLTGWSPFTPGDADSSSMPIAALEYTFTNPTGGPIDAVYSFNARNFMAAGTPEAGVRAIEGGFILDEPGASDKPWDKGSFAAVVDEPGAAVNHAWFRGGWFDGLTLVWKEIEQGEPVARPPIKEGGASPGGSLFVPFTLKPGESKTIKLMLSWYVPNTNVGTGPVLEGQGVCNCAGGCEGKEPDKPTHKPWYTSKFGSVRDVAAHWKENYDSLRAKSAKFTEAFFDTTLPQEVIEAVEANLAIIKSPTVLRQPDGRMWCWEGCHDGAGCCSGSCTHVWNYAQAIPHLFADLERSLRHTEFHESQDEKGHQMFRSSLPIRETTHGSHAAADGQLGGIIKAYREWRVSGDTEWMKSMWPSVKQSMDYCIELWDPKHEGAVKEPHHNTYDIEFWGADGMCTSFYVGALKAAMAMGDASGTDVSLYEELLDKGLRYLDSKLWDGEYYNQQVQWEGLRAGSPLDFATLAGGNKSYSPEAEEILKREGPKYQYGLGCLSDGVIGFWMAEAAGLGKFGNLDRIKSHLKSIHKHNLKTDLTEHVNPQRPSFAFGDEGGLLLCSWPKSEKLSLPFVYSDEVWTGIEYQCAAHMMMHGLIEEGLDVVRTARERYDGAKRNPYDEYECGHWYARAMSSYSLIQGLTGVRYDAVEKVLHIEPRIKGCFRSFLSTATGYATVGVKDGQAFIEVREGKIEVERIEYTPAG